MSLRVTKNQSGFEIITLLLVVVAIVVVALAGARIYSRNHPAKEVAAPTQIKAATDVDQAVKSLESTPVDSQLDPTQLDSDIDSLL